MSGLVIYMEGGGCGRGGRAELRRGMSAFLRPLVEAASRKALRWGLVACGSRTEAYRRFRKAVEDAGPGEIKVLLVDAEELVTGGPRNHLSERKEDKWDLGFVSDAAIHLMVQVMETWIVADPEALARYYGRGFNSAKLPKRTNLEKEPKLRVANALKDATRQTGKGPYHKIRHASELLKRVSPARVKERCPHCKRLFEELHRIIEAA